MNVYKGAHALELEEQLTFPPANRFLECGKVIKKYVQLASLAACGVIATPQLYLYKLDVSSDRFLTGCKKLER